VVRVSQKGLLHVYTGDGKGKTTAALGLTWRALGADMRVCIVQFLKGAIKTSEAKLSEQFSPRLRFLTFAHELSPVTFGGAPTAADIAAVREAWDAALVALADPEIDLVVLDEVNNALSLNLLELGEVIAALQRRPATMEVVCTGRGAPPDLVELADVATEMRCVRHPYSSGIAARRGIEF
jgi:cob(I)alamin adenosyltransferase